VDTRPTREAAQALAQELEARGHKQTYWVEGPLQDAAAAMSPAPRVSAPAAKPVAGVWFDAQRVEDDLYRIAEPYYWWWNRANCWLLRGRDRIVLLDTGLGVASLRSFVQPQADRPLLAVASHVHFDHAGGLYEFDQRAIHEAEAPALRAGDVRSALCVPGSGWVQDEHFEQLPSASFTAAGYTFRACQPTLLLHEGDVLDLGDQALEVLHLPGHSPGAVALWDARRGRLYSGDVVYDGELLDDLYRSDPDRYRASMERLLVLPVQSVYPGHYAIFGRERLHQIVRGYLARRPATP
jgi:glyoxylase-like metal-dependent hydrolase (beta-lactamase superfamily II)